MTWTIREGRGGIAVIIIKFKFVSWQIGSDHLKPAFRPSRCKTDVLYKRDAYSLAHRLTFLADYFGPALKYRCLCNSPIFTRAPDRMRVLIEGDYKTFSHE